MSALAKEKATLDKEHKEMRKNIEEHIQLEKEQKELRDQVINRGTSILYGGCPRL